MAASRVFQLDAVLYEEQLTNSFVRKVSDACKYMFTNVSSTLRPEIKSLLRFIILHQGLLQKGTTFSQSMLGLKIKSPLKRKLLFFILLYVATKWLKEREDTFIDIISRVCRPQIVDFIRKIIRLSDVAIKVLALWNFMIFILHGRYPTLLERIAGLEVVPSRPKQFTRSSDEYTNQEILWNGFTEFTMFVLPFLNIVSLKNWFNSSILRHLPFHFGSPTEEMGLSVCAECGTHPTHPQLATCGHLFCYYCVSANKMADTNYPCPKCHKIVEDYQQREMN